MLQCLQDKLIRDFKEDILKRDDKIATLQNHINNLQIEVKQLHACLEEVVETGEQMQIDTKASYEQVDQSLKKMEAHRKYLSTYI